MILSALQSQALAKEWTGRNAVTSHLSIINTYIYDFTHKVRPGMSLLLSYKHRTAYSKMRKSHTRSFMSEEWTSRSRPRRCMRGAEMQTQEVYDGGRGTEV